MIKLLLFLFITIPLLEIYLLISIGGIIGVMPTILLIILTAILGVFFLRLQGLATLYRIRQSLDRNELPADSLIEGLILLVCGVLLLTPGFFTDTLGFIGLIPGVRSQLAHKLLNLLITKGNFKHKEQRVIIEGEYWQDS